MDHPKFDYKDDKRIEAQMPLRPELMYEVIRREGDEELSRTFRSLVLSGFAAGLAISMSVVAEAMIARRLPETGWGELLADFGYCIGFVMVIIGRLQLFTEHTVTAVLPVAYSPTPRNLGRLCRLWAIVLGANVVGATVAAWFFVSSGALPPEGVEAVLTIGRHMTHDPFMIVLVKGVGAGFLIAALVWMLPAAGAAKLALIILITWLIALAGFAHVVAGTVEIAALVIAGAESFGKVVIEFWIPALIGNMLGGAALFALLAHGQVRDDM